MSVRWLLIVACFCLLAGGAWGQGAATFNDFCPVMPNEKALPEIATDFEGRRVGFCCADCLSKFLADPEAYRHRVLSTVPANPRPWSWYDLLAPLFGFADFTERHRAVVWYVLVALTAFLVALKARALARRSERPGRLVRSLASLASPLGVIVLVLGGACIELGQRAERQRIGEENRNAMAKQAIPRLISDRLFSWSWPQALHELPAGLKPTYYRGNDERSEKLFNGGDYRTATFHLAVRTDDGQEVEPGTMVGDKKLVLRLDIVRAPKTAQHFFTREAMAKVYLVPIDQEGKQKPVPLTTLKPDAHWVVEAPLKPAATSGYARCNAAWGLVVATSDVILPELSSTHYCIACTLHFKDGMVLPESRVWMQAVFPNPVQRGPEADRQWFSDRSIPEITGENSTDPKLLGVPGAK